MIRKIKDNVKDDQELEMLLEEIPQATSHNLVRHQHQYVYGTSNDHAPFERQAIHGVLNGDDDDSFSQIMYPSVASPKSGFSLRSDDSSSSLFSVVHPDNGSVTPPPLEELKSSVLYGVSNHPSSFYSDSTVSGSPVTKKASAAELNLCANLSKMYLSNQYGNSVTNGLVSHDNGSLGGNNPISAYKHGDYGKFKRQFSDPMGIQSPFPPSPMSFDAERNPALAGLPRDYTMGNLFESQPRAGFVHPQFNGFSGSVYSPCQRRHLINNYHYGGNLGIESTASYGGHNSVLYPHQSGMNLMEGRGISRLPDSSLCRNLRPYLRAPNLQQYNLPSSNARSVLTSNVRVSQAGLEAITSEGSFIMHDDGLNYLPVRGSDCLRGQSKGAGCGPSLPKQLRRLEPDNQHRVSVSCRIPSARSGCSIPLVPEYNSVAEVQGRIYSLAKDQNGCRFLQKVFEEGTQEDVRVIFSEIIEHVVELMMNPFGNYLMQKLLDVCNEEQRMQIVLMVTKEPRQLVTISLNTHGTRVIQKLIQTLNTPEQRSLAVSVLEPEFLSLIKDLNGNHVIQHCLQYFSNEDNRFIFVAAAKYCVDIATHQHGCCVLQKCIGHSWGEHRKQLIAEISANALFLAQDQYGNYVVQYILELGVPSAMVSIMSQFQGYYVHLSTQKFSSHVVEKCLAIFGDEHRNRIIHELLSIPHFEQLLQDPHANYVIQSALRYSEGCVHNKLVDTIELHKPISRNNPYSKKLLSQKLHKR